MYDYIYPHFDVVLKNNSYIYLDDCCHSVIRVSLGDISLVYKLLYNNVDKQTRIGIKKFLLTIESPIRNHYKNILKKSLDKHKLYVDLDIEHKTLEEWKKRGIPCMHVLEKQENIKNNKALVYNYINSINFKKIIAKDSQPGFQYQQLLDIIHKIRTSAKSENNPLLLHSDMFPKNFLYLLDEKTTMAIDPGVKLANLPFNELDARLNLDFIYGLVCSKDNVRYINGFLDTLNKEDIQLIHEFNKPISGSAWRYFKLRSEFVGLLRGKPSEFCNTYSTKNTQHIDDLLDRHLS